MNSYLKLADSLVFYFTPDLCDCQLCELSHNYCYRKEVR